VLAAGVLCPRRARAAVSGDENDGTTFVGGPPNLGASRGLVYVDERCLLGIRRAFFNCQLDRSSITRAAGDLPLLVLIVCSTTRS